MCGTDRWVINAQELAAGVVRGKRCRCHNDWSEIVNALYQLSEATVAYYWLQCCTGLSDEIIYRRSRFPVSWRLHAQKRRS